MTFTVEHLSPDVTLYCGDCLEVLPTLSGVNAVVTDPPYGIGESSKNFASRGNLASADKYERSDWDASPCSPKALEMMRSVSQLQIIWGGNYFGLPATSCYLVWDKMGPANDFADCELAWTNIKQAVRRIRLLWNGCMRVEREIQRTHPTQKPVALMEWCLRFIPERATVLDPFMGSGTTGVAAVRLGRKFIGVEIDPKYYAIAKARIQQAIEEREMDMFKDDVTMTQPDLLEAESA